MEINSKDLKALAVLVNKTMHSMEFPEDRMPINYSRKTLNLLDRLDQKYQHEETLGSIREAVTDIPANKMQFYTAAHRLLQKVNSRGGQRQWPSNVNFETISPSAVVVPMQLSA